MILKKISAFLVIIRGNGRVLLSLLVNPPVSGYPPPVLFIKSKIVILFSPFFPVDRIGFL